MMCWRSPDNKIRKYMLKSGQWSNKPTEGSQCTITIRENTLIEDINKVVVLGENDGELWRSIDICLTTMFVSEISKFNITIGDSTVSFTLELISLDFDGFIFEWDAKKMYDLAMHHKEKGVQFFNMNNDREAAYRFIKALKLISIIPIDVEDRPESITGVPLREIKQLKANLYNNLSSCYSRNNHWNKVVLLSSKVLSFDGTNIKALYKLGLVYNKDKNFEKAVTIFNKIIALEPNHKASVEQLRIAQDEIKKSEVKVNQMLKKMFVGVFDS